jgi:hypothetical protein
MTNNAPHKRGREWNMRIEIRRTGLPVESKGFSIEGDLLNSLEEKLDQWFERDQQEGGQAQAYAAGLVVQLELLDKGEGNGVVKAYILPESLQDRPIRTTFQRLFGCWKVKVPTIPAGLAIEGSCTARIVPVVSWIRY